MMSDLDASHRQPAILKMENQGEGNYASTALSPTRDQKTDQGLTLAPKIQSSDPWHFKDGDSVNDEDFLALLGPLDLDLIEEEIRKDDSWLYTMLDEGSHLSQPPKQVQSGTGELPTESPRRLDSEPPVRDEGSPAHPGIHDPATKSRPSLISGPLGSDANSDIHGTDLRQPVEYLKQVYEVGREAQQLVHVPELQNGHVRAPEVNFGELYGAQPQNIDNSCVDCRQKTPINKVPARETPSIENVPSVDDEEAQTTRCLSLTSLSWNSEVPIASVERDSPQTGRRNNEKYYLGYGKALRFNKKSAVESGIKTGLFSHNSKRNSTSPVSSAQNLNCRDSSRTSRLSQLEQSKISPLSAKHSRSSLPLSIALTLAQPLQQLPTRQIITETLGLIASRASGSTPSSTVTEHKIPDELRNLFEKLETKFASDKSFRRSTVIWLTERMASIGDCNFSEYQDKQPVTGVSAGDNVSGSSDDSPDFSHGLVQLNDIEAVKELIKAERMEAFNNMKAVQRRILELEDIVVGLKGNNEQLNYQRDYFKMLFHHHSSSKHKRTMSSESPPESDAEPISPGSPPSTPRNQMFGMRQDEIVHNPQWICKLPSKRTDGLCNGVNQEWLMSRGKWKKREMCVKCSQKAYTEFRLYSDASRATDTYAHKRGSSGATPERGPDGQRRQSSTQFAMHTPDEAVATQFTAQLVCQSLQSQPYFQQPEPVTPGGASIRPSSQALSLPNGANLEKLKQMAAVQRAIMQGGQPAQSLAVSTSSTPVARVRNSSDYAFQAPSLTSWSSSATKEPSTGVRHSSDPLPVPQRRGVPQRGSGPKMQVRTASLGSLFFPAVAENSSTGPATNTGNSKRLRSECLSDDGFYLSDREKRPRLGYGVPELAAECRNPEHELSNIDPALLFDDASAQQGSTSQDLELKKSNEEATIQQKRVGAMKISSSTSTTLRAQLPGIERPWMNLEPTPEPESVNSDQFTSSGTSDLTELRQELFGDGAFDELDLELMLEFQRQGF